MGYDGRGVGFIHAAGVKSNPQGQSEIPTTTGEKYDSGKSTTGSGGRVDDVASAAAKRRCRRVTEGDTGERSNTEEIDSIAATANGGDWGDGGGGGATSDRRGVSSATKVKIDAGGGWVRSGGGTEPRGHGGRGKNG